MFYLQGRESPALQSRSLWNVPSQCTFSWVAEHSSSQFRNQGDNFFYTPAVSWDLRRGYTQNTRIKVNSILPHVTQRAANDNWFPAFCSSPSSSSSWPSGPRCSASSTTSAGMQKDALLLLPLSENCFPFMILYPAYIINLSEATWRNKLTI